VSFSSSLVNDFAPFLFFSLRVRLLSQKTVPRERARKRECVKKRKKSKPTNVFVMNTFRDEQTASRQAKEKENVSQHTAIQKWQ